MRLGEVVKGGVRHRGIKASRDRGGRGREIFTGWWKSREPRGPFGAKEIGEGSTLPVLGAVAHAIANATGVWVTDLPITPEKILRALKGSSDQGNPREASRGEAAMSHEACAMRD